MFLVGKIQGNKIICVGMFNLVDYNSYLKKNRLIEIEILGYHIDKYKHGF